MNPTKDGKDSAPEMTEQDRQELEEYRTEFTKENGKDRSRASPLESQTHESVIESLTTTLELLRKTNEHLREQVAATVEKQWFWPKILFIGATALVGLFFGVNLVSQYVTLLAVRENAGQMVDELTTASQILPKLNTQQQRIVKTAASAHQIMSLVAIGRSYLLEENDASRALRYAKNAAIELENVRAAISKMSEDNLSNDATDSGRQNDEQASEASLSELVDHVAGLVWQLQGAAAWQLGNISALDEAARKLSDSSTDEGSRIEGAYLMGLSSLYHANALTADAHRELRQQELRKAINAFEQSAGNEDAGVLAMLFWSLALCDVGEYRESLRLVEDKILPLFPQGKEDRLRLGPHERAQLALATGIADMCRFATGKDQYLPIIQSCPIDRGSISRADARQFEAMFVQIIRNRQQVMINAKREANSLGLYAAIYVQSLRRACGVSGCSGCSDESVPVGQELYALVDDGLLREFGLDRKTQLPRVSTDYALGKPGVDGVHYQVVKVREETRTRTVLNESREPIEETYVVEVPYTEEIVLKSGETLKEDRYQPYRAPMTPQLQPSVPEPMSEPTPAPQPDDST